jgi:phage terminase large subunit-like protein
MDIAEIEAKIARLPKGKKTKVKKIFREMNRRQTENRLAYYKPYPKQEAFHKYGFYYPERCLGAGNQLGKTLCASMEVAMHLTGIYPDWWEGKRFIEPVVFWVGGVSGETIRDTCQKMLCGRIESDEIGSGSIPKDKILGIQKAFGTPNLLDHVKVAHNTGGTSLCFFKSYNKGREKFQGETIHGIWFDEEPPETIYSEGLTRTNKFGQFALLTFTPLLGMTNLVMKFFESPSEHQIMVNMTIDDVDHYTKEEKDRIVASYPEHEREARSKGIPTMGEGRVFQIPESQIMEEPLEEIPDHWAMLNGLDFGWDHPTAAIQIAWDKDADVIHIINEFKESQVTPVAVANSISKWAEAPTAWPHDGYQHDKGSGKELRYQYEEAGLNMLFEHATHESGGNGVEAGIMEMLERMTSGRLKVVKHLRQWFEEFRLYHRKNGQIVKVRDDLMAATRYAIMMKRYAENKVQKQVVLNFASEFA